jgi:putative chitinase
MQLTKNILKIAFTTAPDDTIDKFIGPINRTLKIFNINVVNDVSVFLAQIGHESGDLKFIRENLNYSSDGLRKVFSKYFPTKELADQYARKPEKIANRVYANRMGNGNEGSGDGWKFRGRGLIQLTGKFNYTEFSKFIKMSLDDTVNYLETVDGATISAGYFWNSKNLNGKDIVASTRIINGGTHGLDDRKKRFERIIKAI